MQNYSHINFSYTDIKKGIILPNKISPNLAELTGIIMGDCYLHNNKNKYVIGIVGNPKTDEEYFKKIQDMLFCVFNIQTKFKQIGKGLRLVFNSKAIFSYFNKVLGIQAGKNKGLFVSIPHQIYVDNSLAIHAIRGIFDTDGSIFFPK